ncbi:MAG: hypothetical protein NVS3B20_16030 [Polyangiales bacterium]
MKPYRLLPVLLAALLVVACDKKSESSGAEESESKADKKAKKSKGDDDDDSDKSPKKKKGGEKDDKGDKIEKVELVDLDLSSIGAAWKGWTIKGPNGAKVMEDMSNLRVAGKGCPITDKCPYFDLILSQKKPDLKATKKIQTDGAAQFKDKITFTEDTPVALEWTREGDMGKSRNFEHIVKVGTKDLGCHPLGSVLNESDLTSMKDACNTIAKK